MRVHGGGRWVCYLRQRPRRAPHAMPTHRAMPSHANPRKGQMHYVFLASGVSLPLPTPDPDAPAAPPELEAESPRVQPFYPPHDNEAREAQLVALTEQAHERCLDCEQKREHEPCALRARVSVTGLMNVETADWDSSSLAPDRVLFQEHTLSGRAANYVFDLDSDPSRNPATSQPIPDITTHAPSASPPMTLFPTSFH
ncbi:hypothetical protein DFH09DRAFT_1405516 [Mycena vulgaris]|nr:hypothetical protein DFH09DRAFT_1405516 [Mycena vulgaris]